jgi:tetratricopeptide (TPR) repeat protein
MATVAEALAAATQAHQSGHFARAESIYHDILRADPHNTDAMHFLGLIAYQTGKPAPAIRLINESLKRKPDNALAHDNLGVVLKSVGRLEEAAESYRQAIRLEPQNAGTHIHLGEVLMLQGRTDDAQASMERAVALAPNNADAHCGLGNVLHMKLAYDDAVRCYRRALELNPRSAKAHNDLGYTLQKQHKLAEAMACYETSVRLAPDSVMAYANLGSVLVEMEQGEEAEAVCRQALARLPHAAELHNSLGLALSELKRPDEAMQCYFEALRLKPDYADPHWNLSLVYLQRGDFERGWPEYEWRRQRPGIVLKAMSEPLGDGSPLGDRMLVVTAEQGLGDTMQFIRYVPMVQKQFGGKVVFMSQKALLPLLSASNLGIGLVPWGIKPRECELQISLMSLPYLFRTTEATIPAQVPYLLAKPDLVEKWGQELARDKHFRIGIAWQGSPTFTRDRARSIPLRSFAPLGRLSGVRLFSLQKGSGSEQLQEIAGRFEVIDLASRLDEETGAFMDTAAVMKTLDLVITSDTSIAHLAGALGVPVWVALSHVPEWRWMQQREDSPWYPTMRLFRQTTPGDWQEVFERIAAAVQSLVKQRGVSAIRIAMAPGELIDKITILEIKRERIRDAGKLEHVQKELSALRSALDSALEPSEELAKLTAELKGVNERLWVIEDDIRDCERRKDFSEKFVELARSVYQQNDHRAALKRRINELLGSAFVEQKAYTNYQ